MAWTKVVEENFTRGARGSAYDSLDTKTASGGTGTWVAHAGTLRFGTTDGKGGSASASRFSISGVTFTANQRLTFTMNYTEGSYGFLRHTHTGSGEAGMTGYMCYAASGGSCDIKSYVDGVFQRSVCGGTFPTYTAGAKITYEVIGTTFKIFLEDTEQFSGTDTTTATGGMAAGIWGTLDDNLDMIEFFNEEADAPTFTPRIIMIS